MNETKPLLVISCPIQCRAGYGAHARDLVWSLKEMDMFNIKIVPQRWGNTPMNALDVDNNPFHRWLTTKFLKTPLVEKPDIWMQVTVPNEFQPLGKYNIGITAGMETTAVSVEWLNGMNRMDMNIVPSKHSKLVFEQTQYDAKDMNGKTITVKSEKPIEILFEGFDENVFTSVNHKTETSSVVSTIDSIKENFAFLFVGHWLKGDFGHDRKDIATLIELFCETFRTKSPKPALILKTSSSTYSLMDREDMIRRIRTITDKYAPNIPPIYLLHGDLSDSDMNVLYEHKKIKSMVSFTKGEGFGRPLLEFSTKGKPIIASNFSGHLDFLNSDKSLLVGGEIKQIHSSATWDKHLIKESGWFYVNRDAGKSALKEVFDNYKKYKKLAESLKTENTKKFTLSNMTEEFKNILNNYVPEFPKKIDFIMPDLPTLTKVNNNS